MNKKNVEKAYTLARERYAEAGVNTEHAMKLLARIPISLHCWQGDDVGGFENVGEGNLGGVQPTGNYPGKARTPAELRADLEKALALIPGKHRVNLHAIYADTQSKRVDRDELEPRHFASWADWAAANGLGLDFNPSYFSHALAADGFTLSSRDPKIRSFWIEHGKACRRIAASFGRRLGTPSVNNIWIPDGYKDMPADRKTPRELLADSLDRIFAERLNSKHVLDALEGKLFGIGSETYVVGSHEFYLGYAVRHGKLVCLDTGHYHPTETIVDKISAILCHLDEVLLHVSRGVRWDSDHVVTLSDDLRGLAEELVRGGYLDRVHIGLDFFDASINRVAAWVIGTRSMLKALLIALLEPGSALRKMEADGDLTSRLAGIEEAKTLPFAAVWDYYCMKKDVPVGMDWVEEVKSYEKKVLSKRA